MALLTQTAYVQQIVEFGKPFVQNFLPDEYNGHPQNWAVIQGNDGLMYFGNNFGVIEYDGEEFRRITLNDVRSFGKDCNGKIYVGSENELGYIYHDSLGQLKYFSLIDKIPKEYQNFYTILNIVNVGEEIYFFGFRSIIVLKNDEFVKAWTAKTDFRFGFHIYDRIFVRQNGIGLMELTEDSLKIVPEGEKFANQSVYFMLPYKDNKILLGTRSDGLFLMSNDEYTKTERLKTDFDKYLYENTLYHGINISEKNYALVTNHGGLVVMDENGKLLQLYNKYSGLESNSLNFAYLDKHKNLWIAANNGIYHIEISTPITNFDENTGLKDLGVKIKRIGNKLMVGTMENFFTFERKEKLTTKEDNFYEFISVYGSVDSYMDLIEFNGKTITACRSGVYEITKNKPILLDTSFFNYTLIQSKIDSSVLYVGNGSGILKMQYNPINEEWISYGNVVSTSGEVRSIIEMKSGNLIFEEKEENIYRANKTKFGFDIVRFDSVGNKPIKSPVTLSKLNDHIIITTLSGNFIYDPEQDNLVDFEELPQMIGEDSIRYSGFSTSDNQNYWVSTTLGITKLTKQDEYLFDFTPFKRIPNSSPFDIYDDTSYSCLWISTSKGIFCYNYSIEKDYKIEFPTYLRKVVFGKDSVTSYYVKDCSQHIVDFTYNSVKFDFSCGFYENPEAIEYSHILTGFDKEWSPWSNEKKAIYTNLPPGSYTFIAKAKNCYDTEGDTVSYKFEILPPWYMTWWAYLIYFVGFILIIYVVVYLNSKRLKAQNLRLERIIQERTAEINQKNDELENQNKLITDSIYYAKHIQDAILPNPELLKDHFADAFVFFKPRDIVSGDFYWFFEQGDKIFIAAGDCTGHGVPGSLMSMMGNTLLNEIVKEKRIFSPAKIFNRLNKSVIALLNQGSEKELTREDGMDISLCCFDKEKQKVTIASANHRVLYITDDGPNFINGDIYSIGGMFSTQEDVGFTDVVVNYKAGNTFYLFSDGYQDQFGGKDNAKFMASKFDELLLKYSDKSMMEQIENIEKTFNKWKGDFRQIDDILVIGIKL